MCLCVCAWVCIVARAPDAQMMNGLLSQHRQCSDTEDLRSHDTHAHIHTHSVCLDSAAGKSRLVLIFHLAVYFSNLSRLFVFPPFCFSSCSLSLSSPPPAFPIHHSFPPSTTLQLTFSSFIRVFLSHSSMSQLPFVFLPPLSAGGPV